MSAKEAIEFEVAQSPRTSAVFTFDEHMWDKITFIEQHHQQGSKLLKEFSTLCGNFNDALLKFSKDLNKCHNDFQHFIENPLQKVDTNYFNYLKKDQDAK